MPETVEGDSFSSRLSPAFISCSWWWWPLWLVGFDFPLLFWMALLQQLGILSILSCCGSLILFGFFFPLPKRFSGEFSFDNWAESRLCLEFISPLPAPGYFLGRVMLISVINRNPALRIWVACEHRRECCSYRKCPQGSSIIQPTFGSCSNQNNQNLRESLLLGQWKKEECAWANLKGLESQLSFSLKHRTNSLPGPQYTAEVLRC